MAMYKQRERSFCAPVEGNDAVEQLGAGDRDYGVEARPLAAAALAAARAAAARAQAACIGGSFKLGSSHNHAGFGPGQIWLTGIVC